MLLGLTSYNILKNPRFAHAFAISSSFAERYVCICSLCVCPCDCVCICRICRHTEVSDVLKSTVKER